MATSTSLSTIDKQLIKQRDGCMCLVCGYKQLESKLTIHHITPTCFGGGDAYYNLASVCIECHPWIHNPKSLVVKYVNAGWHPQKFMRVPVIYLEFTKHFGRGPNLLVCN